MFTPEIFYGIGAVVLLGVLAWGYLRNRGRNRANDPITEAATKAEYDHPDTYDKDRRELDRQIRPS